MNSDEGIVMLWCPQSGFIYKCLFNTKTKNIHAEHKSIQQMCWSSLQLQETQYYNNNNNNVMQKKTNIKTKTSQADKPQDTQWNGLTSWVGIISS